MPSDGSVGNVERPAFAFPFILSTPVWGAGHLGLFLNVSLPSLLSAGNLPGLTRNPQNRYLIYTRPENEAELKAAATFALLSEIIAVEVILIREEITEPHRTMSDCHIDSFQRADEVEGAAIFLPPDCVWSDNSLVALERIARGGKSVVHMSGIRLDRDAVLPELAARYTRNGTVLSLPPRELVDIGLRHLHPIALTHFWKDYGGGLMPANLIWNVAGQGLLHPLMVKSQVRFAKFASTIDDDLALRACPDASRDYVVTDSDEILAFEMSGLSRVVGTVCPKGSIEGAAAWAEIGTNERHRELIKQTIRLKARDDDAAAWNVAQAESDDVVTSMASFNANSFANLLRRSPKVFASRAIAAVLGRGDRRDDGILLHVVRYPVLFLIALLRFNRTLYSRMFLVNGLPRITHPTWLVRKALVPALQNCILQGDRIIVLIGGDPLLGPAVRAAHPNSTVYAFASGSYPDLTLLGKSGLEQVDTLVVIDVNLQDLRPLLEQRIGRRRVLLRLAGDTRPVCGDFNEVRYFGDGGARVSSLVWDRVRRFRASAAPTSQMSNMAAKAAGVPFNPFIYLGVAIAACSVNVFGLLLDVAKRARWALFRKQDSSLPRGPST